MTEEERQLWEAAIDETIDAYRDFLIRVGSEKHD